MEGDWRVGLTKCAISDLEHAGAEVRSVLHDVGFLGEDERIHGYCFDWFAARATFHRLDERMTAVAYADLVFSDAHADEPLQFDDRAGPKTGHEKTCGATY